jgi:hypothetical protein
MAASEIEVAGRVDTDIDVVDEGKTIFDVLANQARERSTSELRTTAVGFAVNASLILWYHPSLSWLGAAFGAISAYGVWGLADRLRSEELTGENTDRGSVLFTSGLRLGAAIAGSTAGLYAAFKFMAVALGHWIS